MLQAAQAASWASHRHACIQFHSSWSRLVSARPSRLMTSCVSSTRMSTATDDRDHSFYNYTSGRWLYNEGQRLSERRHCFDVDALRRIAAHSVHRSTSEIAHITKIAEGGSYRIFEIAFQDVAVVARLPYPATIPRKFGIASEVATMQYLALHGIPVPKIFDWSNDVSNSLRSEYMIMEKVPGKELEHTWYTMTLDERKTMIEKIVNIESKLFSLRFPANGSLYFKDSLDSSVATVDIASNGVTGVEDKFCIGPSTEYLWWYHERDKLGINGGPWRSTKDVLAAPGQRELEWMHKLGRPRQPRESLYRGFYNYQTVDPRAQICNLTNYLKVAPYLEPKDQSLNTPTLRHPDFSPNNIFISESGDINGIIDWQHSVVLPMFLQAKIPKHFQNYGDSDSESFQRPTLPEGFESLSESEKQMELENYQRRQVHYFYLGFTSRNNKLHFQAMAKYDLIVRNQVYEAASRPWEGDSISLKAALIHLGTYWPKIAGNIDLPFSYSEAEVEECLALDQKQKGADEQMQNMRDHFGVNIDGWVPNEKYKDAKGNEKAIKERTLALTESEQERKEVLQNWPFQDHEEVD